MTTELKAIETTWNGYRFRSRLEARYAIFFEALCIPYEYEREGYDLDGVYYLPDFWLPKHNYWIEIKGQEPTQDELLKCEALTKATGYPTILFYGEPLANHGIGWYFGSSEDGGGFVGPDIEIWWYVCLSCRQIDLSVGDSKYSLIDQDWNHLPKLCHCHPQVWEANHVMLRHARDYARSMRFEAANKTPEPVK